MAAVYKCYCKSSGCDGKQMSKSNYNYYRHKNVDDLQILREKWKATIFRGVASHASELDVPVASSEPVDPVLESPSGQSVDRNIAAESGLECEQHEEDVSDLEFGGADQPNSDADIPMANGMNIGSSGSNGPFVQNQRVQHSWQVLLRLLVCAISAG